jgi:hypothetical protein
MVIGRWQHYSPRILPWRHVRVNRVLALVGFLLASIAVATPGRLCRVTKRSRSKARCNSISRLARTATEGETGVFPAQHRTPVDLMRETLGQGSCEYILDLAGIKPRQAGGDRQTLAYATCGLWSAHISPIVRQMKTKTDGTFEPLDEKTKTHLIQAIEDMWYFVRAIHDRLREYQKWGADADAFCKRESARNPQVQPIADVALTHVGRLNADLNRHKFEGPNSEAYWKDRIPELIRKVTADQYAEVASIGAIRGLGNDQDERVSRCRQYVKAVLQEIAFQDTRNPDVRAFAAELRERCHRMLRNQHPKEGF